MIRKLRHFAIMLLTATFLFGLSSCDDDWFEDWYDDDWWEDGGFHEDRHAEEVLRGRWYVDYVAEDFGECPYFERDEFIFKSSGRMEVRYYGSSKPDYGIWWVHNRRLYMDFNDDGYEDVVAYIDMLRRYNTAWTVKDLDLHSGYYMELER